MRFTPDVVARVAQARKWTEAEARGFLETVATRPARQRVQVRFKGELIADSRNAIVFEEGSNPPAYYVPREDVRMERLRRTEHTTYCPFKGHASYFSLIDGPENAVWSYEEPVDEMRPIRELLAFYPDKVDSIIAT
jgi:uncharacterized protein (DUF427 family)